MSRKFPYRPPWPQYGTTGPAFGFNDQYWAKKMLEAMQPIEPPPTDCLVMERTTFDAVRAKLEPPSEKDAAVPLPGALPWLGSLPVFIEPTARDATRKAIELKAAGRRPALVLITDEPDQSLPKSPRHAADFQGEYYPRRPTPSESDGNERGPRPHVQPNEDQASGRDDERAPDRRV